MDSRNSLDAFCLLDDVHCEWIEESISGTMAIEKGEEQQSDDFVTTAQAGTQKLSAPLAGSEGYLLLVDFWLLCG
jgi:hypothetical protein